MNLMESLRLWELLRIVAFVLGFIRIMENLPQCDPEVFDDRFPV